MWLTGLKAPTYLLLYHECTVLYCRIAENAFKVEDVYFGDISVKQTLVATKYSFKGVDPRGIQFLSLTVTEKCTPVTETTYSEIDGGEGG